MMSRWSVLVLLVAVAGIALAGAASIESTPAPASLAPAPPAASDATTPSLETSPFVTEAPEPMAPCQNYAWQCYEDGGACGPLNQCNCLFHPGTGWICGR